MLLAGPISHTSTQYMDFVEIFNISLDLSTGCWASFVYSCHSMLECYNLFSGVKLSIRSFCCIYYLIIDLLLVIPKLNTSYHVLP